MRNLAESLVTCGVVLGVAMVALGSQVPRIDRMAVHRGDPLSAWRVPDAAEDPPCGPLQASPTARSDELRCAAVARD